MPSSTLSPNDGILRATLHLRHVKKNVEYVYQKLLTMANVRNECNLVMEGVVSICLELI
jgi:hypothetical protein